MPTLWNKGFSFERKDRKVVWQCNGRYKGSIRCKTPNLTEEELKEAFLKAMRTLWKDRDTYIEDIEILKADSTQLDELKQKLSDAEDGLDLLVEKIQREVDILQHFT